MSGAEVCSAKRKTTKLQLLRGGRQTDRGAGGQTDRQND